MTPKVWLICRGEQVYCSIGAYSMEDSAHTRMIQLNLAQHECYRKKLGEYRVVEYVPSSMLKEAQVEIERLRNMLRDQAED